MSHVLSRFGGRVDIWPEIEAPNKASGSRLDVDHTLSRNAARLIKPPPDVALLDANEGGQLCLTATNFDRSL